MSTNALACTAMRFLQAHENEHLAHDMPRLIARCVDHLVETCSVSRDTAHVATLQAQGELESRHCKASIDCSRTTSFTVFINTGNGNQVITAAALARLMQDQSYRRLI